MLVRSGIGITLTRRLAVPGRETMSVRRRSTRRVLSPILASVLLVLTALAAGLAPRAGAAAGAPLAAPARLAAPCKPGTTKRIAFMLKQQTAFRYLHADVPFFKQT